MCGQIIDVNEQDYIAMVASAAQKRVCSFRLLSSLEFVKQVHFYPLYKYSSSQGVLMALSPMACKVYFGFHSSSNPWIFLRLFLLSEIFRSSLLYGVPVYLRYITLQKASFSQSWPTVQFPLLIFSPKFPKLSELRHVLFLRFL